MVRCLCLTTGVSHCTNLPIVDCFRLTKSCPSPAITAALWDVDPLLRCLFPLVLVQCAVVHHLVRWCTRRCLKAALLCLHQISRQRTTVARAEVTPSIQTGAGKHQAKHQVPDSASSKASNNSAFSKVSSTLRCIQ